MCVVFLGAGGRVLSPAPSAWRGFGQSQAARCGLPTAVWLYHNAQVGNAMRYNPSPRADHGLRTWYGASSPNDRTMFSTSFLETFARKNEAYAATIAVESLPPSPDECIPYFAGD